MIKFSLGVMWVCLSMNVNASRVIEVPQGSDMTYANLDSIQCLAVNAYHEARSESDHANLMIMAVVYNRMKDKRFPNTLCDVVFQKAQFSWTNDGLSDKLSNEKQYNRLYKLAEKFLTSPSKFVKDSKGVNHYHTVEVSPHWKDSMRYVKTVENHKFYKW